jgi:hypothetical protein
MYFDTFPGAIVAGAVGLAAGMWIRDRGWHALRRKLRRGGLPERTAAAPFHAVKPFATTLEERRAVALRAIYDEGVYELLPKMPIHPALRPANATAPREPRLSRTQRPPIRTGSSAFASWVRQIYPRQISQPSARN